MKTKMFIIGILVLLSTTILAQENEKRFGVELNGGASIALNKLDETTLNPGFGFEGILHYRFLPHIGAYAGWGWNRFGADQSFAGDDVCFEETGYVFGLQYKHPVGTSNLQYYVRGGGLYNHIETENKDGDIINDSGHGLGWQLAGGIELPLKRNWAFVPGVKFNFLNRETEFEEESMDLDYNYVSLRVGFIKRF